MNENQINLTNDSNEDDFLLDQPTYQEDNTMFKDI